LYALADLFVFPSWYEGFGLPVLEAMACGCPVVCSSATSLPEVGGRAVIYADPDSPEEFAARIQEVLKSEELRQELADRGRRRAAEFSCQRYAAELVGIYEEVVSRAWPQPVGRDAARPRRRVDP
jgi:glycosyltransferase involved in cell wall biosynthesis